MEDLFILLISPALSCQIHSWFTKLFHLTYIGDTSLSVITSNSYRWFCSYWSTKCRLMCNNFKHAATFTYKQTSFLHKVRYHGIWLCQLESSICNSYRVTTYQIYNHKAYQQRPQDTCSLEFQQPMKDIRQTHNKQTSICRFS